jgi:hypothetical protein
MIDLIPIFTAKRANEPAIAGPLSTTHRDSALAFDQGRIVGLKLWALAMSAFQLPQQTPLARFSRKGSCSSNLTD